MRNDSAVKQWKGRHPDLDDNFFHGGVRVIAHRDIAAERLHIGKVRQTQPDKSWLL